MTRVALITAAGSGIGAACARRMAESGWQVAVGSSSGKGQRLGEELGGLGFTASNTSPGDIEAMVDQTVSHYGRIDAVINSCGPTATGELLSIDDEEWHAGLEMILLSILRLCRAITPIFEAQGGGSIVNVSSFAAVEPDAAYPVSSVMRAALGAFCKLYADRHGRADIRMNNLLAGFILTKWPERDENRERIPLGRYGDVEEFAATAAFLVSDEARYITGQNIRIDGGLTRSL